MVPLNQSLMPLKSKATSKSPSPFSWDALPSTPSSTVDTSSLPEPPTSWLSARDMKLFGARPMSSDIGVVKCIDCDKPVLRSFMSEHADNCRIIRSGSKKGSKGAKPGLDLDGNSKKRKPSPTPSDPSLPPKKKPKAAAKITKGRIKGPVDPDKHCCVINDKNLPCSRSLTCKSHSMGAKRAVLGRSRNYDELLIEWQKAHNPNYVEPVKKETKAEKKEKREKEKAEKKRLAVEAATAAGIDLTKKGAAAAFGLGGTKKGGKKAAAAAVRLAEGLGDDVAENLDDLDSEAEMDDLTQSLRTAWDKGVVGVPLAIPCDAGSWFVARRERKRCCRDLLMGALGSGGGGLASGMGIGQLGVMRTGSAMAGRQG